MPAHAPAWVQSRSPAGRTAAVSVVIPTLAEAPEIAAAVRNALAAGADEVVVADGGSHDGTPELARAAGARVLLAPRGRGSQLNAGARAARGDVLCFLHADARLPAGAARAIRRALDDPRRPAAISAFASGARSTRGCSRPSTT